MLSSSVAASDWYAPTTVWSDHYAAQADTLHRKLSARYGSTAPFVLIGHSNGGMVSRYLGRHPEAGNGVPLQLQGVITIGTPHVGAELSRLAGAGYVMVGNGLTAIAVCAWTGASGCRTVEQIGLSDLAAQFVRYGGSPDVLLDMHTNDAFHSQFNSEPEAFQRYGITSHIWPRWAMWRAYGDLHCREDDNDCGGGVFWTAKIDRIYHHDIVCSVVAGLLSFVSSALLADAEHCAADAAYVRATDALMNRILNLADGDVIVSAASQRYPNVANPSTDLFDIFDGPAHWRETSSARVRDQLVGVLASKFGMPRQ